MDQNVFFYPIMVLISLIISFGTDESTETKKPSHKMILQ